MLRKLCRQRLRRGPRRKRDGARNVLPYERHEKRMRKRAQVRIRGGKGERAQHSELHAARCGSGRHGRVQAVATVKAGLRAIVARARLLRRKRRARCGGLG